jgi:hypothetical protein
MEPTSGPTIFADFLEAHGEGIHHVTYNCNNISFEERLAEFERRGYKKVQSGSWMGPKPFRVFWNRRRHDDCFETYAFPDDGTILSQTPGIPRRPSRPVGRYDRD